MNERTDDYPDTSQVFKRMPMHPRSFLELFRRISLTFNQYLNNLNFNDKVLYVLLKDVEEINKNLYFLLERIQLLRRTKYLLESKMEPAEARDDVLLELSDKGGLGLLYVNFYLAAYPTIESILTGLNKNLPITSELKYILKRIENCKSAEEMSILVYDYPIISIIFNQIPEDYLFPNSDGDTLANRYFHTARIINCLTRFRDVLSKYYETSV